MVEGLPIVCASAGAAGPSGRRRVHQCDAEHDQRDSGQMLPGDAFGEEEGTADSRTYDPERSPNG